VSVRSYEYSILLIGHMLTYKLAKNSRDSRQHSRFSYGGIKNRKCLVVKSSHD